MQVARIYLRVSTEQQDLTRQSKLIEDARTAGYYVAGVYKEKASGARADRPELLRMIDDLQPGEIVVAEKIDRISRLPLSEAEKLIYSIKEKGAKISIPGLVDLSDIAAAADGVAKIVLESIQDLLLKIALQMARDDYELRRERQKQGVQLAKDSGKYKGKKADTVTHQRIIALRSSGQSIHQTSKLAGCSVSQVKRIWSIYIKQCSHRNVEIYEMCYNYSSSYQSKLHLGGHYEKILFEDNCHSYYFIIDGGLFIRHWYVYLRLFAISIL